MRWRLFQKHSHGWSLTGIFKTAKQAVEWRERIPQLAGSTPIRIRSNRTMYEDVERHINEVKP